MKVCGLMLLRILLLVAYLFTQPSAAAANSITTDRAPVRNVETRGHKPRFQTKRKGAKKGTVIDRFSEKLSDLPSADYDADPFLLLAHTIRPWVEGGQAKVKHTPSHSHAKTMRPLSSSSSPSYSDAQILEAFHALGKAQQTLKALDGISHEAYQRTHSASSSRVDSSVRGRARRSAARANAAADGLWACELCEFMKESNSCSLGHATTLPLTDEEDDASSETSTPVLSGRTVLYNKTLEVSADDGYKLRLSVVVLFEPDYTGGAGIHHGGVHDALPEHQVDGGRILILLRDSAADELDKTLQLLRMEPMTVPLLRSDVEKTRSKPGGGEQHDAVVQPLLYQAAGTILEQIGPCINQTVTPTGRTAFLLVGRSLAGGVASIAATILDGALPMPQRTDKAICHGNKNKEMSHDLEYNWKAVYGRCRDRTSAITLGAPPCLSGNIRDEYITSILFGDDIICRITNQGIQSFLKRVDRALKRGGVGLVGRQLSRVTDTLSLAADSLSKRQSFASSAAQSLHVPGRAFLVRPRRLQNLCSMHEVGRHMTQKREAMRAAVLWQLHDIVLSKSLWKHHQLDSYIHGLDRVQLRGVFEVELDEKENELDEGQSDGEDALDSEHVDLACTNDDESTI